MRESRTYGSVRGAYDETHVPTATRHVLLHPLTAAFGASQTLRDVRYPVAIGGKADDICSM